MGRLISRPSKKKEKGDWLHGRAECPKVEFVNPLGPIIEQCKVSVVRKLSNRIVARAEIFNYRAEYCTEIFLICEGFVDGEWVVFDTRWECRSDVNHLQAILDSECDPCEFITVRAYFFVNAQGMGTMQQVYLEPIDLWNNWGRSDGLDEQRFVPLNDFYDGVPRPTEPQQTFPKEEDEWDGEYPYSYEEEEYYIKTYGDD